MPAEISSTTVAGVSAGQPKPTSSAVGEVDGGRFSADLFGCRPVEAEVHALDEHVGGGHDAAVRCGHDGRVVAGAEQGGGGL
jgi:hypothetical protein